MSLGDPAFGPSFTKALELAREAREMEIDRVVRYLENRAEALELQIATAVSRAEHDMLSGMLIACQQISEQIRTKEHWLPGEAPQTGETR